jgi:hypothetical protein
MALSSSTLAGLLYSKFESKMGRIPKKAKKITEKFTEAVAEAVIEHLKAHAVITMDVTVDTTTTVTTADAGLQRDPITPFGPTLAPSANKTLSGTGTGTGTGTLT